MVGLGDAVGELLALAVEFLRVRGDGDDAPWHVDELPVPLAPPRPADPRARAAPAPPPLPFDDVHVAAVGGALDATAVAALAARSAELVVTPWRGVLLTDQISTRPSAEEIL